MLRPKLTFLKLQNVLTEHVKKLEFVVPQILNVFKKFQNLGLNLNGIFKKNKTIKYLFFVNYSVKNLHQLKKY